ncbi:MAG TPA: bifunctional 2-C-methyl-D-erythritol 4-phosphate cytidylyltransferase/2-C-methyl-D-erythritol 2,4-cyclodiphosphate synthase [Alphaproteobacteria bacterium]|nr:bifunctional 2-C-methyl-D-erythritol 4-phosphate cytidylyltransferase/2-C-methyl-D-erythritol 2,4-cyclodiphosphate synthase [Alphaproteobacteria bacterium]
MTDFAVLIVAAGRGSRFGRDGPKQYAALAGRPLLAWAIKGFLGMPSAHSVTCVIHRDDREHYAQTAARVQNTRLRPPVLGGATRQASVRMGLEALALDGTPPESVLIHDAARPLVPSGVVERVLTALRQAPGAIPALPVADTLKRAATDGVIAETVPREGLWRAQTPQGFRFTAILAAHRAALHENHTDDADLLQAAGERIALVEGAESLLKVTTMADLANLESQLAARMETRTGFGYDVHAFGDGDHVVLGGVCVPHARGLAGHSDADVGLHALCDAIYGALADGDIGQHFPPSQAKWRGADSAVFLEHAAGRVRNRGGAILHLDLTLVCESPKVGPHREAMRARIAGIAGLPLHRVAVKATTSEKLGFTGREEGIAAHAVATVRVPAPTESADGPGP